MTQAELNQNQYAALLESKEAELAGRLGNRDGIEIEKMADPLDEVQSAGEREVTIRNLHSNTKLLRNVRGALNRMAHGTYGACLRCDEPISAKRLAAVPWTTCCIRCQEAADRECGTPQEAGSLLADAA
jgi:DnaK suppressor protein